MSTRGFTIDYGWGAPTIGQQIALQGRVTYSERYNALFLQRLRESFSLLSTNGLLSAKEKETIAKRLTLLIMQQTNPKPIEAEENE
jgi:hypothetical protein